jgi:hypothetical protein
MAWRQQYGQIAFVKHGNTCTCSASGGRFGGVKLARVSQEEVLDFSKFEYFTELVDEQPRWTPEEKSAALVVPAPVGELSVMWNEYLKRWIMTYLDDQMNRVLIREAQALWGPWSPALTLVSSQDYPGKYGAYMHPWYVEIMGDDLLYHTSGALCSVPDESPFGLM